jgi:hypothetical protein
MLAWAAIVVGAFLALMGLAGIVGGVVIPGLGARVEPRLDGLGHLLLALCLLINGGSDAADSDNVALGSLGSACGLAGIIVLVLTRRRAPAAIARKSRTIYGGRNPDQGIS